MKTRVFSERWLRVLLSAALVVLLATVFLAWSGGGRTASTSIQWRDASGWNLGWQRLAYCSEQNASLRGWKAELGPVAISYLRSVGASKGQGDAKP